MNRIEHANGVVTIGFEQLADWPVQAHIATRHGGVSPAPWHSLNFSVARGDTPERVEENRRRLAAALYLDAAAMVRCQQVHGVAVRCIGPEDAGSVQAQTDGLITGTPLIPLTLVFADCVPVLLYDTQRHVLGVCHAGWRGTVAGNARETLAAMTRVFGTEPQNVRAGIGPSIGPASYEVGEDVRAAALAQLPHAAACFSYPQGAHARPYFDLWSANRMLLEAAGVPGEQIEIAGIDTAQNTHDFFSHRGERGRCGLFCMVAWLQAT